MDDPVEVLRDFAAGVCCDPSCQDCQEDHRPTIANAIDAVLSERDRLWDTAAALREENARLRAEFRRVEECVASILAGERCYAQVMRLLHEAPRASEVK